MNDDRNFKTPSFSIPESMMETLETIARREDRSVSSVIRRAVELYREQHEERHGSLEDEVSQ
jgi:Arc/MetJ-type ribon-helix-helix transcriptional regulator